jgi:hypothetical protein
MVKTTSRNRRGAQQLVGGPGREGLAARRQSFQLGSLQGSCGGHPSGETAVEGREQPRAGAVVDWPEGREHRRNPVGEERRGQARSAFGAHLSPAGGAAGGEHH